MDPEKKLEVLRKALEIFAPVLKLDPKSLILMSKQAAPVGRHLHAWTYPADAFLEGPGGSMAIAFRKESLEQMDLHQLVPILAHEACHALLDADRLRRGDPIDERRAEQAAEELLHAAQEKIAVLLKEAESGA